MILLGWVELWKITNRGKRNFFILPEPIFTPLQDARSSPVFSFYKWGNGALRGMHARPTATGGRIWVVMWLFSPHWPLLPLPGMRAGPSGQNVTCGFWHTPHRDCEAWGPARGSSWCSPHTCRERRFGGEGLGQWSLSLQAPLTLKFRPSVHLPQVS